MVFPLGLEPLWKQLLPPWWRVGWQGSRVRVGIRGGANRRLEREARPPTVEPILKFRSVAAGWKSVPSRRKDEKLEAGSIIVRPSRNKLIRPFVTPVIYTFRRRTSRYESLSKPLSPDPRNGFYIIGRPPVRRNSNSLGKKHRSTSIRVLSHHLSPLLPSTRFYSPISFIYINVVAVWKRETRSKIERIGGGGLRFATLRAEEESLAESRSGKKRIGRRSMKRELVVGRATCATRRERGYKR